MLNVKDFTVQPFFAIYVNNINGDRKQDVLQSVILLLCLRF